MEKILQTFVAMVIVTIEGLVVMLPIVFVRIKLSLWRNRVRMGTLPFIYKYVLGGTKFDVVVQLAMLMLVSLIPVLGGTDNTKFLAFFCMLCYVIYAYLLDDIYGNIAKCHRDIEEQQPVA